MTPFNDHFSEIERAILQERAKRLASQVTNEDNSGQITALRVHLGNEIFVFPLDELITIIDNATITPVPCVPPHIAGITNVRGRITPVINLAILLGITSNTHDNERILIVAKVADERNMVAFWVHLIGDLVSVEQQTIEPLPSDFDAPHPEFFIGISENDHIILNTSTILNSETLTVDDIIA